LERMAASSLLGFGDIASCLSQVADFNLPHLHSATRCGRPHSHFKNFGIIKLEWAIMLRRLQTDPKFNLLDRIQACDRQTDRQADRQTEVYSWT